MLSVQPTREGDCPRYKEDRDGVLQVASLDYSRPWVIECPSKEVEYIVCCNGGRMVAIDGVLCAVSTSAAQFISKPSASSGCAAVVKTYVDTKPYYIAVADSEPYIRACEGLVGTMETPVCAIQRIVRLELGVWIPEGDFVSVGYWDKPYSDPILGTEFVRHTELFYVVVDFDKLSHLGLDRSLGSLRNQGMATIDVANQVTPVLVGSLSNTRLVILFGIEFIECPLSCLIHETSGGFSHRLTWSDHHFNLFRSICHLPDYCRPRYAILSRISMNKFS